MYSHNQLYILKYMQKHNDAITTSGHSSLEKYTSHFIERVVCERWVGDWTKTATYWPPQLHRPQQCIFFVLLGCSTGYLGPNLSAESWFPQPDLEHWLQALNSNCLSHPGYILVLRPLNSTRRQSRLSPDLLHRIYLLFTQVHFSFDRLAESEVNVQHFQAVAESMSTTWTLTKRTEKKLNWNLTRILRPILKNS